MRLRNATLLYSRIKSDTIYHCQKTILFSQKLDPQIFEYEFSPLWFICTMNIKDIYFIKFALRRMIQVFSNRWEIKIYKKWHRLGAYHRNIEYTQADGNPICTLLVLFALQKASLTSVFGRTPAAPTKGETQTCTAESIRQRICTKGQWAIGLFVCATFIPLNKCLSIGPQMRPIRFFCVLVI